MKIYNFLFFIPPLQHYFYCPLFYKNNDFNFSITSLYLLSTLLAYSVLIDLKGYGCKNSSSKTSICHLLGLFFGMVKLKVVSPFRLF
jgi:hypothetical protein